MKLLQALEVIAKLPVSEAQAVGIQDLCARMKGVSLRTMQRYMEQLSAADADHSTTPLVKRLDPGPAAGKPLPGQRRSGEANAPVGRAYRYFLDTSALRRWFMTDQVALNLLLADQMVGASIGGAQRLGSSNLAKQASDFIRQETTELRRVSAYVRIVPDGLGRRPARIEPAHTDCVLDAIARGRQLQFSYVTPKGSARTWELSPRGLVAKDGTLYLIGTAGLSDAPRTFALHRVRSMAVSTATSALRDFDIDQYLEATQHLSHGLGGAGPVTLRLRVDSGSLYHFLERPLWNQTVTGPDADGHSRVTAIIPASVTLIPFLLSMSPGVEVLGPPDVREALAERLSAAAAFYARPPAKERASPRSRQGKPVHST